MIDEIRRLINRFIGKKTMVNENEPLYGDYDIPKRCKCGGEFVQTGRGGKKYTVCFRCGKPKVSR